jgi:hypothetical protein
VPQQEAADAGRSKIENQLQRRNDLSPNLVNTVKGFAAREKPVLAEVTKYFEAHEVPRKAPSLKFRAHLLRAASR